MKRAGAETWNRVGETTLLSLVFLAPLAVHARTYDPAALKTALFESCALLLAATFLLKGLARGRWEAAAASWPALAPVLALAAWTLARFAAAPFKTAALPDLALTLSAWIVYAVALLEFGGARSAARLAFWTTAAAALVGGLAAAQRLAGPGLASNLTSPDQLAAFAAAALPVVLAQRLDPEASASRRLLSASTAAVLALLVAWSGSARGLAAFSLSSLIFAAAAVSILSGPAARRAAMIALGCAAAAVLVAAAGAGPLIEDAARFTAASGSAWSAALRLWSQSPFLGHGTGSFAIRAPGAPAPDALALRSLAETGLVGAALLAWTLLAAAACGLRSAAGLRRHGALAEAGYAAAFASAFAAWALAAALGLAPAFGPGAWLAWAAAGLSAGMVPLARPRGVVLTMPLPFGEDVRRLMRGPALILFLGLVAWPAGWLASDVLYNRAVAESRAGSLDAALADAGRVWPGSPVYAPALYLRGRVLLDQGKPGEALDAFARLDDVSPDFSRVHARRAEAYATIGDWSSSVIERERQADLTPLDLPNLTAWAEAARAAGDMKEARRAADRAQALAPSDETVRLQIAANTLLEKRLADKDSAWRGHRRKGMAFKPLLKPR